MAERKPGQREEQQRMDKDTAASAAEEVQRATGEAARQGRKAVDEADEASRRAAQNAASALDEQAEQGAELTRDLLDSQTELAEVAVRTVESATDVGAMSTRVWASFGSAWVGLVQKQMQFTIESLSRLRETHGLTRPLETQARFLRETVNRTRAQQQGMGSTSRPS